MIDWCIYRGSGVGGAHNGHDKDVDHRTLEVVSRVVVNDLVLEFFGGPITFDCQSSHINVIPPPDMTPKLPFDSMWLQPGCYG